MKIGLLTFHRASNYGTALQAIASVEALRDVGADAEIVDYRPDYIEKTMHLKSLSDVRSFRDLVSYGAELLFRRRTLKNKIVEFASFIEKLPHSEAFSDKELLPEMCKKYDMIVSGSDQIWNPVISTGDMSYFLPFTHPRKAAFSSSFGTCDLSAELKEEIAGYLEDFGYLTVREMSAKRFIDELIADGHNITEPKNILDPTLLYGIDYWKRHEMEAPMPKEGYILVYSLLPTPLIIHATEKIRRETGLPVLNLRPSNMDIIKGHGANIAACGPAKFISYLANATYVVTNSFHGTAFSLNFEKPFITVTLPEKNGMDINSRLTDVLALTGMSHRRATTIEEIDKIPFEVDFTEARKKLASERERSWELLRELVRE